MNASYLYHACARLSVKAAGSQLKSKYVLQTNLECIVLLITQLS